MKKIGCIGSVNTDVILSTVDRLPDPGALQKVESSSVHVGGCASNAAIDLARLGVPVLLVCKVGRDSFGDFVLKEAGKAGVDTAGVIQDPSVPTTTSVVCVNSRGAQLSLQSRFHLGPAGGGNSGGTVGGVWHYLYRRCHAALFF